MNVRYTSREMQFTPSAVIAICTVLALPGLLGAAAPSASLAPLDVGVRDLSSFKQGDVAKLPRSTMVKLPKSGRIVSVDDLWKAHDARMARFANAKTQAAALAARLHFSPRLALTLGVHFRPIVAPTPVPTLDAGVLQNHLSQLLNASKPQLLPVATSEPNNGYKFAKDYIDFCMEFKASACIYFPADMAANNPGQDIYSDGSATGFFDSDYLVDQQQCIAGYGNWDGDAPNYRCDYVYPAQSFVRWTETTPPTATLSGTCLGADGTPMSPYTEQYDHYGVLMITFNGGVSPSQPCFVQVYAIPT